MKTVPVNSSASRFALPLVALGTLLSLFSLLPSAARAASVILPNMTTVVSSVTPQATLTSQNQWTVDLNDRTGLTVGAPIRIVVTTSEHFLWTMTFRYDAGNLSLTSTPSLNLLVGNQAAAVTQTLLQDFGMVPAVGAGGASSDVAGYLVGTQLPSLELVVPWSADLTQVRLRLSQNSQVTGTNARLTHSSVNVSGGLVNSSSSNFSVVLSSEPIPEPGSAMLVLGILLTTGLTRKRPL